MPIRSGCFAAALLGCVAALAGEAQPAGLLPNPSFEQAGTDGLPVGFRKYVYGAQPTIAFDSQVKKAGRQSLRVSAVQPSDTAIAQDIQLKPGAGYRFTGWVRTSDLAPEPRSWTHGTFQIQDASGRALARCANHQGTTDWTQETACFVAPADGRVRVACFFIGFGRGTGTAWFDALQLEEVPVTNEVVVTTRRLQKEPISPFIYGNFVELLSDLVPSMWAEKLDVTSFEFLSTPEELKLRQSRVAFDPRVDPHDRLWRQTGDKAHAEWLLDPKNPFNGKVSQRIRLGPGGAEAGIAQESIFVEKSETYQFVGHFRQRGLAQPVHIELHQGEDIIAHETVPGITTDWAEYRVALRPAATTAAGSFVIRIAAPGTLWVDRVSLMPAKSVAGWRPDVVAAVRAMKPGIIRWGGSVVEAYDWRKGIGPWQKRVPFHNAPWGRVDPNFVGVDEFIAFCRAVEAEPLICVRWSGQKPSDAADLVEYCNGPATSPLGALRARNGHAEPYAVQYWQIGNEVGGGAYDSSIADCARAMRKADPAIRILSSYVSEAMLKNAGDLIDYVCPHHYGCADLQGTEADIRRYADLLQRFAPDRSIKLAVTEWNTTAGDFGLGRHRLWTLWNGLACARYLNLCRRYADLVKIACRSNISNSYCSGIIQTNNHAVYGTPAYHVAKLYAEHGGAIPLALDNPFPVLDLDISANLSADGKALSLIVVNPQAKPVTKSINASAFRRVLPIAPVWTIADADSVSDPEATNSFERPERITARASRLENAGAKFPYAFAALSVTLIELSVQE